jgi:hypothetical protein
MTMMNKLATLSATERRQIIDDFTAEVFDRDCTVPTASSAHWDSSRA